jgi:hypothetical protein
VVREPGGELHDLQAPVDLADALGEDLAVLGGDDLRQVGLTGLQQLAEPEHDRLPAGERQAAPAGERRLRAGHGRLDLGRPGEGDLLGLHAERRVEHRSPAAAAAGVLGAVDLVRDKGEDGLRHVNSPYQP